MRERQQTIDEVDYRNASQKARDSDSYLPTRRKDLQQSSEISDSDESDSLKNAKKIIYVNNQVIRETVSVDHEFSSVSEY